MIKNLFRAAPLLLCMLATAQAATSLTVGPSGGTTVGGTAMLNISVVDAVDLYAWQMDVTFGPVGLLNGAVATVGSFLGSGQTFGGGMVDNASGTITTLFSALSGALGVDGNGVLASLSFSALQAGVATVSVSNVQLLNSNLDPIFPGSVGSATLTITAIPEPATVALLGLGLLGVVRRVRRQALVEQSEMATA